MAANESSTSLPNEEAISSLVRRVYRAITEEVPRERSREVGANFRTAEEELSRRFQIPRTVGTVNVGSQRPPFYNPRVNYGCNGNGKKGKSKSCAWKGKSPTSHSISSRELVLLPAPDIDEVPRFGKKRKLQEMGLIIDCFPLDKSWDENQLKFKVGSALVDVLQDEEGGVIPFEFVKTIGKSICPLNLFGDKELTAATLAGLCRQGPIYVRAMKRLKVWPAEEITDVEDEGNEELEVRTGTECVPETSVRGRIQVSSIGSQSSGSFQDGDTLHDSDTLEVEVTCITTNDQKTACVSQLREMFPNMPKEFLKKTLQENDEDLNLAVADILKSRECTASLSLETLLNELGAKVEGDVVKIKVDPGDILNDALAHYKDPDFDAAAPMRVTYRGQPAVDLGGVKRQFFTDFFAEMASSTHLVLLEGPDLRKSPAYNSGVISSGLMKLFGTAVAHGIVHAKVGIPFLSQAFYWYIATADVNKAIPYALLDDICDQEVRQYVDAVLSFANEEDMSRLNEDDRFTEILSASGVTTYLSVQNRMSIAQAILHHYVLNTRKVCMDQFREGLRTLDVLQSIEKHPSVWEPLFVHSDSSMTAEEFKSVLRRPISMSDSQHVVWQHLLHFVDSCSLQDLKKLSKFLTGSENLNSSGARVKGITVSFDGEAGSVFSSTCTLKCQLPPEFPDYESFSQVMLAVINDTSSASFTVV